MWINYLLSGILILLVGGAIWYVVRSKRRGEACIGCPYAKECTSCQGSCSSRPAPVQREEQEKSKQ